MGHKQNTSSFFQSHEEKKSLKSARIHEWSDET
jgi:hypothetical protein